MHLECTKVFEPHFPIKHNDAAICRRKPTDEGEGSDLKALRARLLRIQSGLLFEQGRSWFVYSYSITIPVYKAVPTKIPHSSTDKEDIRIIAMYKLVMLFAALLAVLAAVSAMPAPGPAPGPSPQFFTPYYGYYAGYGYPYAYGTYLYR